MGTQKSIALILWVMVVILLGSGMGVWTGDVSLWYEGLNRSVLTPPNAVFPVVWTFLYALIGVCGWMIWGALDFRAQRIVKIVYMLQLGLNWMWTPIFFHYHWVGGALVVVMVLAVTIGILMVLAHRTVSVLMLPYLVWVLFAAYLNFYIWWYN
jgi:benzodiazapine receptor